MFEGGSFRGLRARDAVWGSEEQVLKDDDRSRVAAVAGAVIKHYPPRGPSRAFADLFRGSPARRAWRGGHGLLARRIGAARPLAFAERRRFFIPVESYVVLEDLRGWEPADRFRGDPCDLGVALARLARDLHRRGVVHGDLKASHVLVAPGEGASTLETRLLDLEGVRFRRRLRDADRIRTLAQLNASLPDRFENATRRRAFERYAAALPFEMPSDRALRLIVSESLARAHRWTGKDCQAVTVTQRK